MLNFVGDLFDTSDFMARWGCGSWTTFHGYVHIVSDLAIWGAYMAIPCVLMYFILKRRDIPFSRIFWLFGAFIFACGTGHLIEAIIFWRPVYRLDGLVKVFTAIVSWGTVFALVKITPQALKLPGMAKLNQERERLLESERCARTDAERASRAKDEFLSLVSHELRTPLNAMLGYSQLLGASSMTEPDEVRQAAQAIERNGRAQSQIIDDLLDMSRIITGKMRLDVQSVDLCAILNSAIETVTPAAEAKEIRLTSVLDPRAGRIFGDVGRLQQVFWNLFSNAIKFTPRRGRVQVCLERINSHVEVHVSDNGQGIRPEFLPYVFDRFRQEDATSARQHGGLGLGLSIVKHLVELHGGSVQVRSPGVDGIGTTFTVHLPIQAMLFDTSGGERVHPSVEPPSAPLDQGPMLTGLKALVIDDDPDARDIVRRFLEERGVEVHAADAAEAGLNIFQEMKFDVVLSDIGLPGADGYQFIRSLRQLPSAQGGRVPAAALTAFARSEDRTRTLLAGYQAHLTKPVNPQELIAVVAAITGRAGSGAHEPQG